MKTNLNFLLGIGGAISMVASPILAFSGIKTDVAVIQENIDDLKQMKYIVMADHDLILQMAARQGIDTSKAVSLNKIN